MRLSRQNNKRRIIAQATLVVIVFAAYISSLDYGFVNWDDLRYIERNPYLKGPFFSQILEIFTNFYNSNYLPLHLLSYLIDYKIWGLNPVGYHLTGIILHAISSALIFSFIFNELKHFWPAMLGALIFALHPVCVESVVWISERKNALSMLFLLASMIYYQKHVSLSEDGQRPYNYMISLMFFTFSLLSKPAGIILPVLLLAYDMLFMKTKDVSGPIKRFYASCIRALPFLVLSLGSAVTTILAQHSEGAIKEFHGGGPLGTLLTMAVVMVRYPLLMLLPHHQSTIYQVTIHSWPTADFRPYLAIAALIAVFWLAYKLRKSNPMATFAILWFYVPLLPVSNIIPIAALMSDRYLYVPMIGVALLVAFGVEHLRLLKGRGAFAACLVVVLLTSLTVSRQRVWADSLSLWKDARTKGPDNCELIEYLAGAYNEAGRYETAARYMEPCIAQEPDSYAIAHTMAQSYAKLGQYSKAEALYNDIIKRHPSNYEPLFELGGLYLQMAETLAREEARALRLKAVESCIKSADLNPNYSEAYYCLGTAYAQLMQAPKAVSAFKKAVEKDPYFAHAHLSLGILLLGADRPKALYHLKRAIDLDPDIQGAERIRQELLK